MPTRKKAPPKKKLTPKQERFADNYIANGGNGAKAARDAGYPKAAARVVAVENLTKPNIQERIQARTDDAASLKSEEVIGTLAAHLRSDITEVLDADGGVVSRIKEKGLGHLVKKIKVRREVEPGTLKKFELVEIELYGSQSAAIQLAKILGLEKKPAENPEDEQAKIDRAIAQFMAETGQGRDEAIKYLAPLIPEVNSLIN